MSFGSPRSEFPRTTRKLAPLDVIPWPKCLGQHRAAVEPGSDRLDQGATRPSASTVRLDTWSRVAISAVETAGGAVATSRSRAVSAPTH
jgi:hypothetical protein